MNVHLIFNAHIDPVWLWPWEAGIDEALATCRSACDRLDAHPDIVFTRGEAWIYSRIERLDPELFARISEFVRAGRWEIVGGWWVQPDCNQPSSYALEWQIELGRHYFESRFALFPKIAWNVDSFGHAAALPGLMRKFGQTCYVMMRPQEHEMALPSRLFRWRGYPDGPEVTVFRIAGAYTTREMSAEHIVRATADLPSGIGDTMCLVGVGDHGGGPTERQIAWLREHWDAIAGCRLLMSSPSRYFDAIARHQADLPLVVGELQPHAIGCYSVLHSLKSDLRRAETALEQVQTSIPARVGAETDALLRKSREYVCFNQFHDALGGTCIPSAYDDMFAQLGFARATASELLAFEMRRRLLALPDCENQRIALWNASISGFDGIVEVEPWTGWSNWNPSWRLFDESGVSIGFQQMEPEALTGGITRLAVRIALGPGDLRVLEIRSGRDSGSTPPVESFAPSVFMPYPSSRGGGDSVSQIAVGLSLIDDDTDTWSHGIEQYGEQGADAEWEAPNIVDNGGFMRSWMQSGVIGESRLRAEWRAYAHSPHFELRLSVDWRESNKVLKLVFPAHLGSRRTDGVMGGNIVRANDGRELPLRDWTLLPVEGEGTLGIVCPDVYALDADAREMRARLTLLRSPVMAHHDPHPGTSARRVFADQGMHRFRFEIWTGLGAGEALLEARASQMQRPPLFAELTRGMRADRT